LRYRIGALPTFFVLGSDGKIIGRVEGLDWPSLAAATSP
jgi:hypothetical protein